MSELGLKSGDLIEILSAAEILSTLNDEGALDQLPFMPEMATYCGKRFMVDRRAEKVCDTVNWTGSRRFNATVLLAEIRCNGSGHAGCQAECRFFWKESWLRKVAVHAPPLQPSATKGMEALLARTNQNVKTTAEVDGRSEQRWRCQATELPKATVRLGTFDPRPYVREYTCGNVPLGHFIKVTARAAVEEPLRKIGLVPAVPLRGQATTATLPIDAPLNLQPGELVKVRSKEDIQATLNDKGYNRGLWFDREMLAYCGGTFRVRQRVNHFIDDRNGKMIDLKTDAVTLENVICTGDRALRRWFCPRAIFPFWRESWLQRVDASA